MLPDQRRERRRSLARRRLLPGPAGDYIGHGVHADDKVLLCCRVSRRVQKRNQNLDDQESNLRRYAQSVGAVVVGVERHVGPGWDPLWLASASRSARQHDAILLAESTSRFVRHAAYHSVEYPKAQARKTELDDLEYWTSGMPLATIVHPSASPGEERSFQIKRGQDHKHRKGGRPLTKKRRRERLKPKALEMKMQGMTIRKIAGTLSVPHSTVQDWLRDLGH